MFRRTFCKYGVQLFVNSWRHVNCVGFITHPLLSTSLFLISPTTPYYATTVTTTSMIEPRSPYLIEA